MVAKWETAVAVAALRLYGKVVAVRLGDAEDLVGLDGGDARLGVVVDVGLTRGGSGGG